MGKLTVGGNLIVSAFDDKLSFVDKIVGKGIVTGATYKLGFKIETQYCPHCKKMIFDTDVTK